MLTIILTSGAPEVPCKNIVPVDTGLAKGIERILPALSGRFTAMAVRVPTINVSAMDLTLNLSKTVTSGR